MGASVGMSVGGRCTLSIDGRSVETLLEGVSISRPSGEWLYQRESYLSRMPWRGETIELELRKYGTFPAAELPSGMYCYSHIQKPARWWPVAWLAIAILFFIAAYAQAEGVNVKQFGAAGDGVTDDSGAIRAAANYCAGQVQFVQQENGSFVGTVPELIFPSGKYLVSETVQFGGYQGLRGDDSIIVANGPIDVFRFPGCYRNRLEKLQFVGGGRQVVFENANVDMTRLNVRDCSFQGWSTVAIVAEGTGPDLHLSATLTIQDSTFDGGTMLITRADTTQVSDCRHQFRGPTITAGTAGIYNKWRGGVLGLRNLTATPNMPTDSNGQTIIGHWIDNAGSVVAERCRFGGESAGIPVIHDRGGPNIVNPWLGRKIALIDSQVSCGRDIWPESGPIILFGLPQAIRVVGCYGLVSNSIPIVRLGPGYDCAADVASVTVSAKPSLAMYSIVIQGNQFYVSQPIPVPLQQFVR